MKTEKNPTPHSSSSQDSSGTLNSTDKPRDKQQRYLPLWGGLAGLVVGLGDFAVLHWLNFNFNVTINDKDALWLLLTIVSGTYALLGYVAARLYETKQDIARDKSLIEQQLQALRASQQKNVEYEKLAAIGRLAAGVAHEVRNPLAVIKSATALIVEESQPLSAEGKKAGNFVHQEIARLDNFIGQLLDFSKPTNMQFGETDIANMLAHLNEVVQLEDTFCDRVVAIDQTDNLPLIECDSGMITQALLALLRNAAEATTTQGKISLSITKDIEKLVFWVRDDGPGIDAENQQRLFEPFFTNKAKGTGLGLVMAERIVSSHLGKLQYIPNDGLGDGSQGACFKMTLPLHIDSHLINGLLSNSH